MGFVSQILVTIYMVPPIFGLFDQPSFYSGVNVGQFSSKKNIDAHLVKIF